MKVNLGYCQPGWCETGQLIDFHGSSFDSNTLHTVLIGGQGDSGGHRRKGEKVIFVVTKKFNMGLLTPKGKKGDKKASSATQKPASAGSKFISKSTKAAGGMKKGMTGGSQRGS